MNMNEQIIYCGIYRTTQPIADTVKAGVLVLLDTNDDIGPGVYLPREWRNNRAIFHDHGIVLPHDDYVATLEPLRPEGLYRVASAFFCCEKRCQYFEENLLVQLGYNSKAQPILFVPEMVDGALALPDEGTLIADNQLTKLVQLRVLTGPRTANGTIH